mgnify:CR=1 FL=1
MSRSKTVRKTKAAKPAKPEKMPSPAPGNFVVLLVDRVNLGQPHRMLRLIPEKLSGKKLKTTGLGRYAQRYHTEKAAADDIELRSRLIPAKYRAIVTDIRGIDFEAYSPAKMKRLKAKAREEAGERAENERAELSRATQG